MSSASDDLDSALALRGIYNLGSGWRDIDLRRVRLNSADEISHWTRMFGVTERDLRSAVERAGDDVDAVRRELGGR